MISDFLLKNIDNFFHDKANLKDTKPFFNQQTIKRDLSTVIRSKRDISQNRKQYVPAEIQQQITKSRLKTQLQQNKQSIVQEIIKRTNMIKSKSSNKIGYKPNAYNYDYNEDQKQDNQYQYRININPSAKPTPSPKQTKQNIWRDVSPKRQRQQMHRMPSRSSLISKYKQNQDNDYSYSGVPNNNNINSKVNSTNPYMPSKDHAVRERQCRLPIKGYNKYRL